MRVKSIPSGWLARDGRRLDCGPYMSGALEAKVILESLKVPKEKLSDVTRDFKGGIYNGPQFKRNYVTSRVHGVPFLTGGDILRADLSNLPLLSSRDALSSKLRFLEISHGMTLISCSGAIGRMAFARPEMGGIWSSQDVMKVVPDPEKIPPGYLYAYLSSKFGVPLVVGGTYGAIIQHIEPHHIANLPVPRLSKSVEEEVHELVVTAAKLRDRVSLLHTEADAQLVVQLSLPTPKSLRDYSAPYIASSKSSQFVKRGDAYYYAPLNTDARRAFDAAQDSITLTEIAEVRIPGIFKREYVEDAAYGVPYITGADVFQLTPTATRYLQRQLALNMGLVLRKDMIVIQEAGQLGGLIGRSALVGEHLDGYACSNNMVRVTAREAADTGYLFAILSSAYGVRLISREAAGSSIPHLEEGRIRTLSIPWPNKMVRTSIGQIVMEAQRHKDDALDAERRARVLVEEAIEEAAN